MKWQDKTQVKKGDIGEQIVKDFLEDQGYLVYKCATNGSHPFDGMAWKEKKVFYFDVKTKARMNKCNCTGFDLKHYKTYNKVRKQNDIDFYVYFVDDKNGKVHKADLKKLENIELRYFTRSIVGWDISDLDFVFNIGADKVNELSAFDTRNYEYKPEN
tara:strand:- start:546 stop:1019 length:474 start_codon:yes stop_codon:yes gene_type:complete